MAKKSATLSAQEDNMVSAYLKQVRLSPRKARLVAAQIRGKPVGEALELLRFSTKKAAFIIGKILNSAVANAEHNNRIDPDNLYVHQVLVDHGPIMKRISMRARGRADQIHKPTSHIRVMLLRSVEAR